MKFSIKVYFYKSHELLIHPLGLRLILSPRFPSIIWTELHWTQMQ